MEANYFTINNANTSNDVEPINLSLSLNYNDNKDLFKLLQSNPANLGLSQTAEDENEEVTHGTFFGENIKRVVKVFSNSNG